MPIMAMHEQNDARGSARLLANAAKRGIENPRIAPRQKIALNNLFRLLEAYRSHRFFGFDYEPRAEWGSEALTLLPPMERHVAELRDALDRAFADSYSGIPREEAIKAVEELLRATRVKKPIDPRDRQRASNFITAFISNLYPDS